MLLRNLNIALKTLFVAPTCIVTADEPGPTTPTMFLVGAVRLVVRGQPPAPPLLPVEGSARASRINSEEGKKDGVRERSF